jgi:hypothetical protein
VAGNSTGDMFVFGIFKASKVSPTRVLPGEKFPGFVDDPAWRIDQARLQGRRTAFPRFKASIVQWRTWVAEYLAVDEFQQLQLGRGLLQFLDDFRVLVGLNAIAGRFVFCIEGWDSDPREIT